MFNNYTMIMHNISRLLKM